MSSERWQKVSELFVEATRLSPGERVAFLAEHCSGDADLIGEVESLLAHECDEDVFFENAPHQLGALIDDNGFDHWLGCRLGKYRLTELVSSRGMGVVFLAEQDNPRRTVAIKLLVHGLVRGRAKRRFEFESEILGRLRHPCVAEIYEAGQSALDPSPDRGPVAPMLYFAMEYVEGGESLLEFSDGHRLSLRQKLSLFIRICDGVQHGHQKGVIHRDLKPSNILVTCDERATGERVPLPKIIDFGVAKCTDADIATATMQTATGELIGTLQYMSPEQCGTNALSIDTRADIYALGVILYQLVTGRVPYDVSNLTIQSAARVITETDPEPASRFNRKLRGDLETIIAKAMSKDREDRYESAAALSDDLQRYMNGEPINARKPTRWVQLMRWITRHPRWAAAIGSVSISATIIGATGVSIHIANAIPCRLELTQRGQRLDSEGLFVARHGDRAVMYAASGRELHEWTAGDDGIRIAAMVNRPEEWGGGKVVVLAFAADADEAYRNHLCIFDAGDPERLVRKTTVEQVAIDAMNDEWPRPKRELSRVYRSEGFTIHDAWIFDVFPDADNPGEEIVVFHQYEYGTQGALRVYNLRGEVLFQVWQDGGVFDAYWMSRPGLLVCSAIKGDRFGEEYGRDLGGYHPRVLFAIRPRAGEISTAWVMPYSPADNPRFEGDPWEGKWYHPEWYRVVCPAKWSSVDTVVYYLRRSFVTDFGPEDHTQLHIRFNHLVDGNNSPYFVGVDIDAEGTIVNRPLENNGVIAAQAKNPSLPTRYDIDLVEWTKFQFPCPFSESPSSGD